MKTNRLILLFCGLLCCLFAGCASPAPAESSDEPQVDTPYAVDFCLGSGHFTAGVDFPAGTYTVKAIQWAGTMRTSNSDETIYIGMLDYNTTGQKLYTDLVTDVELPQGTILSLRDGVDVRLTCPDADPTPLQPRNQEITEQLTLTAGRYTAGVDFPAGVYNLSALDGVGNVESSNMHGCGVSDIMGTAWRITEGFGFCEQDYKNVEFPEGTVLSLNGVTLLMTPSK